MRTATEILAARAELRDKKITPLRDQLQGIRAAAESESRELTPGEQEKVNRLDTGLGRLLEQDAALRQDYVLRLSEDPANVVEIGQPTTQPNPAPRGKDQTRNLAEGAALRWIERSTKEDLLTAPAADRLDSVVRDHKDFGAYGARYLAAVGDEHYRSAFWRILTSPQTASYDMSQEEHEAVRTVRAIMTEQRAMSTGTEGQLAVPGVFDPTILLSSDGAINPLRQISRVETIATHTWNGITSAGVTASYDAESTEVSDDTPTLTGPTVTPEKAQAFIEFSIELGQDWSSAQRELARVLADSKDVLEADKFTNGAGSGSSEPEGVVAGLAVSSHVNTATTNTFASADVFTLQESLPARFQARARFVASIVHLNSIAQFESAAGARLFPETADGRLLRKPLHENSDMDATGTLAGGELIVQYGDYSNFLIVDRIGMSIELVPHMFATANNRPSGNRGLYAFWRNSSVILMDAAFRLLRVKAS